MKAWLRSNWKDLVLHLFVIIGLTICVLEARAADPCQESGWAGVAIADTDPGQVVIETDQLAFAAYNADVYIFSYMPAYNRLIVPQASIVDVGFEVTTCTYHVEFIDIIFRDQGN